AVLAADPSVVHAAVTVATAPGGGDHLVAYLAGAPGTAPDLPAVAATVAAHLPEYMRPTVWTVLDALPLNTAGKIDRKALPEPEFGAPRIGSVAPEGATERALADVVAGLLGVDEVSVTESFFSLGGDSIMSIQLSSRLRAAGLDVTPRDIFTHRTIRAIARAVSARRRDTLPEFAGGGTGPMLLPPSVGWLLEHADTAADYADFSQSVVFTLPPEVTADQLRTLLGAVVAAHPMLTARLADADGRPTLIGGAADLDPAAVRILDTIAAPGSADFDRILTEAHAALLGRLDPATGRLVAAVGIRPACGGTGRLLLAIHHLAVDIVSWSVLADDLGQAWTHLRTGTPIELPAEVTSMRRWSSVLDDLAHDRTAELELWKHRLPHQPTVLGTRLDRTRDRQASVRTIDNATGAELTEALLGRVPDAFRTGTIDILTAALAVAVGAWQDTQAQHQSPTQPQTPTGPAEVSILLEGHGREEQVATDGAADLSRTVGWFTSFTPLTLRPGTAVQTVRAVKELLATTPDKGIGFAALRYGGVDQDLRDRPLPPTLVNFTGATGVHTAAPDHADPTVTDRPFTIVGDGPPLPGSVSGRLAAAALSVHLYVGVDAGRPVLHAEFGYPQHALAESDVAAIVEHWQHTLAELVDVVDRTGDLGFTPSDVPGTDVTQDDLDTLTAGYPGADLWPLSPLQRGLYIEAARHAGGTDGSVDVYVTQAIIHLDAGYDAGRLRASAAALLATHRVLRSGFVRTGSGALIAVVPPRVDLPWRTVDLTADTVEAGQARLAEIALAERVDRFDLARPPLIRFVLVELPGTDGPRAAVIVTNHHLLFDGWSGPLVLAGLIEGYVVEGGVVEGGVVEGGVTTPAAPEPAARPGTDYADFLDWLHRQDRAAARQAWRAELSGVDGPTLVGGGATATVDEMPREHVVRIDAGTTAALEQVARTHHVTTSTVVQFAWAVLLSRLTGRQTVTFGETVSGRPPEIDGVETAIGLFINTLPVAVTCDPEQPVTDALVALQASKTRLLDHQHLGLPEIAEVAGDIGFDTLTIFESYPVDGAAVADGSRTAGLPITGIDFTDATHYPLNLFATPTPDGLGLDLKYLPSAFGDDEVAGFAAAIVEILAQIATPGHRLVGELELLSATERERALERAAGPVTAVRPDTVDAVIAERIAANPAATALVFADRTVTYGEFGARVTALARELVAGGVGPDVAVAVCIPRSVEMMVAIHAIVFAGGQYVPIDVATPADRAEYMLRTAGAVALLVPADSPDSPDGDDSTDGLDSTDVRAAATQVGLPVRSVDASGPVGDQSHPLDPAQHRGPVRADHAVYTIFTSGSTGRPKGVTLTHGALINRLWWGLDQFPLGGDDVVVQKTPYTFDCSVPELFAPLMAGARTLIARPGGHADPLYLADLMIEQHATMVHFVPSMLSVFVDVVDADRLARLTALRYVSTTGEALPPAVAAQTRTALPHARFYNLYGPTEAAVEITYQRVDAIDENAPSVPIGVPLPNSTAYVLDARLRPVPPGIPGELYLGGVQVARGYAARGDLTAERFIADPFGRPGGRLYRTGDLVAVDRHGTIDYLGRTDFQVKLRGQRIELGEIEAALAAAPGVVHAAATVAAAPGGAEHLVAYLAAGGSVALDLAAVTRAVAETLPEYMRPTVW
ncbi:MAG: amino acid adenylation domain-containing protein, partial [Gordonia sp. (in: high G+C Gram-positive bacteria)]